MKASKSETVFSQLNSALYVETFPIINLIVYFQLISVFNLGVKSETFYTRQTTQQPVLHPNTTWIKAILLCFDYSMHHSSFFFRDEHRVHILINPYQVKMKLNSLYKNSSPARKPTEETSDFIKGYFIISYLIKVVFLIDECNRSVSREILDGNPDIKMKFQLTYSIRLSISPGIDVNQATEQTNKGKSSFSFFTETDQQQ